MCTFLHNNRCAPLAAHAFGCEKPKMTPSPVCGLGGRSKSQLPTESKENELRPGRPSEKSVLQNSSGITKLVGNCLPLALPSAFFRQAWPRPTKHCPHFVPRARLNPSTIRGKSQLVGTRSPPYRGNTKNETNPRTRMHYVYQVYLCQACLSTSRVNDGRINSCQ